MQVVLLPGASVSATVGLSAPPDRSRFDASLSWLRLASELVDMAGRGLAPYVAQECLDELVDVSVELADLEVLISAALPPAPVRIGTSGVR